MKQDFNFKITSSLNNTLARTGVIHTPHGNIETPAFIIGGTKATVKGLTNDQIIATKAQAVLANTYHLMLAPGTSVIKEAGGINQFMNFKHPTFTDSGGFQVFSLGMAYKKGIDLVSSSTRGDQKVAKHSKKQLAQVDDEGVHFRSHLSGERLYMSPEISMQAQHEIGADIIFAFDELTAPLANKEYIKVAMDRTHNWALSCLAEHQRLSQETSNSYQALFGIVQGARVKEFREESANILNNLEFDGYGIGGIFEPQEIAEVLGWTNNILNPNKPRHLLGMGSNPIDLFLGVEYGIDTFDCVAPTRQARNGALYTYSGRINIKNAKYKESFEPIEDSCRCYTCRNHTKAYLNHLFHANEILGGVLGSIHNEYFIINTVDNIRESIQDGSFLDFKNEFLKKYYQSNMPFIKNYLSSI